jgi:hypothetical protein
MSENSVVITESGGKYHIQNNGISEFALIGILECIIFDLKTVKRQESPSKEPPPINNLETAKEPVLQSVLAESVAPEPIAPQSNAPELRTRISNAVKAIKDLGGDVGGFDADTATNEELQEELAALTEQYKRLKNSKAAKK